MSQKNILIVGSGITGLTAAFYLKREIKEKNLPYKVKLVEKGMRLGGKIQTVKKDGFTIERGPDSFLSRKKPAVELVEDLVMSDELVRNGTGQSYILVGKNLHKIPPGSFMGIPVHVRPFLFSDIFSTKGKLRAGMDLFIPKGKPKKDQSLGMFFRQRFGDELVENLIDPLLSGIYSGDMDEMSLMATFPNFYQLEQEYGSLIKGLQKTMPKPKKTKEKKQGIFFSLKNGLESLVDQLGKQIGPEIIEMNKAVDHIEKKAHHYHALMNDGTVYKADAVIMATPHNTLPKIFSQYDFFRTFEDVPMNSVANVALAFDKSAIKKDIDGTGFVVSRNSKFRITACTWTHKKWPNAAPEGKALVRCYVGRPDDPEAVNLTDDEMVKLVLKDLNKIMRIKKKPLFHVVSRWKNIMPQYTVGHVERLQIIKEEMNTHLPGIYLAGSSFEGVGLPDCIDQGKTAVSQVLDHLKEE